MAAPEPSPAARRASRPARRCGVSGGSLAAARTTSKTDGSVRRQSGRLGVHGLDRIRLDRIRFHQPRRDRVCPGVAAVGNAYPGNAYLSSAYLGNA
jgi:hypothetical protein